jgi:hypothetical protein
LWCRLSSLHAQRPALPRLLIPLLILFFARIAPAAQFPDADPASITNWITQLTSDDFRARREAVRNLVRAGPPVEAPLHDLLATEPNPEFRLRAAQVLRRVEPTCRTEPTLVTLELKSASVKSAFDQLARIEGAPLRAEPPHLLDLVSETVTARFDHEPYWNVVLELLRRANLHLRCNESGVTLVRPANPLKRVFAVSGMFLVTPTWLKASNDIGPGLRISVFAEPRARVLRGDSPFTLTRAVDSKGHPCISESNLNAGGSSAANGYSWSAGVSPSMTKGSVLKVCKGTARVIVAETYQTLEAPGFASPKSLNDPMPIRLTSGGVSASVVRVINTGDECQIDLSVSTDPNDVDWDSLVNSVRAGGIHAYDSAGSELTFLSAECDGPGPTNNFRCRWTNRLTGSTSVTGEPYKIAWTLPSRTVHLSVPFELHDVVMH